MEPSPATLSKKAKLDNNGKLFFIAQFSIMNNGHITFNLKPL